MATAAQLAATTEAAQAQNQAQARAASVCPRNTILVGDVLAMLATLPDACVQTVITSPPYWGLRDYGVPGQLGLECTPEEYVARLVEVFAEVRRVLRDDGTCWINTGDCYANQPSWGRGDSSTLEGRKQSVLGGVSRGISANLANCLDRRMKGQSLVFGNAATIGITAKRRNIALQDERAPDGVFLRLLGVKRVTIKQRDNDFCQVLHTLNRDCYCWIAAPLSSAHRDATDLELVLDVADDVCIVISEHDANGEPVLGVFGPSARNARKGDDTPLPIKEAAEPVTKWIADGETVGDAVTFDTPLKRFPDVYVVDQAVALRDGFHTSASLCSDFRVTQASKQQLTLALGSCGINLRAVNIAHLFAPNAFGSLVRYSELYHKAKGDANERQPKQEMSMPDLLKRALKRDGWICRSTIIWAKPSPMPEAVTDRPTRAHEYIFLMAKSQRYYYDAEAIREPHSDPKVVGGKFVGSGGVNTGGYKGREKDGIARESFAMRDREYNPAGRNKRDVWTVASQPFPGAHFATFAPRLIEPCILAGSSPRACEHCGAPWRRVTEREPTPASVKAQFEASRRRTAAGTGREDGHTSYKPQYVRAVLGESWRPTCRCAGNTGAAKSLVLDPFMGAGTVGVVCRRHSRDYLGIDINPEYAEMARQRIAAERQPHIWTA